MIPAQQAAELIAALPPEHRHRAVVPGAFASFGRDGFSCSPAVARQLAADLVAAADLAERAL